MDSASRLVRLLPLPLGDDEEIGLDLQQLLENQWEALCGWFFQREDFRVEVIQPKKPAMAFEVGLTKVIVEERFVLEFRELQFVRSEIQDLLQNSKCPLPAKKLDGQEVVDLQDET